MKTTKTSLTLLLAALATVLTTSLAAAPEPTTAMMYPVTAVTKGGKAIVEPGMWRADVRDLIGVPQEYLTHDVWIYRGFYASHPAARTDGCDRLVIAFENGRVSSLYAVNPRAEVVVNARIKSGKTSAGTLLASVPATTQTRVAAK